MSNYTIRKAKKSDMEQVMSAHRRSIIDLCSKDYNPEKIEQWADVKYNEDIWNQSINNEYHIVVEVNDVIEGFCHAIIRDDGIGEIVGLYFSSAIAGQGIARKSFEMAMDYIKSHSCKKVILRGTKTAKGFYEHMGFKAKDKVELNVRGADLECYKMELFL